MCLSLLIIRELITIHANYMTKQNIFIAIIIILSVWSIQTTKLTVHLAPKEQFCFDEDLPLHTVVRFAVDSHDNLYKLIIEKSDTKLRQITSKSPMIQLMTTQQLGHYRYCLKSQEVKHFSLSFQFLVGVHAKDYGNHLQGNDYLTLIEQQAEIAKKYLQEIERQNNVGADQYFNKNVELANYSLQQFLTIVFIGTILLVSYIQYVKIRSHLKNRKYI